MAKWLPAPKSEQIDQMLSDVETESDRASAIISATWVDDALLHYLKSILRKSDKIEADLFKGNGPLSTFSTRCKIAYYCHFIGENIYHDLHIIREVRNKFAHYRAPISYDESPICDLITNLKTPILVQDLGGFTMKRPRTKYITTTVLMSFYFIAAMEDSDDIACSDEGFMQICRIYTESET